VTVTFLSSVPSASRIPVLLGLAGLVLWSLAERGLHAARLRQSKGAQRDRGSFLLLMISWYGAVIFALLDALLLRWSAVAPALVLLQYVGVLLVALGLVVRLVARVTLGRAFSPLVQTTDAHQLVNTGIYASIRHPAYLGTLCLLIGFPASFGSLIGLGIAIVAGIPALIYRIRVEERALRTWFGEAYEEYSRGTSRLIPYVW
jgi:protein-S-isoprenylcysteine O-methyltransferase Ste14